MYCRKCGKQIDDDSKFCEHCGYQFNKNTRKNKGKKIIIAVAVIIVIITIGILYGFLNPSKDNPTVFAISRDNGSTYIVDLSKAYDSINTLKADWSIENQIGIIDNLEDKATSVFVLKSKNIENNEEDFDSYYYASYIDLNSGTIEDIDIQIPKSYGVEEALNQVGMELYRSGKGASICLWSINNL